MAEKWGNQLFLKKRESLAIYGKKRKLVFFFRIKNSVELSRLYLFVEDLKGSPPPARVEIVKAENLFYPEGEVITASSLTPPTPGWHPVALEGSLSAGDYFLAVSNESADEENHFSLSYLIVEGEIKFLVYLYENGVWRRRKNTEGLFLFEFLDGSVLGNTYTEFFVESVFGEKEVSQVFTLDEELEVNAVSFRVRKKGERKPKGDLEFILEDVQRGEVLESGVIVQKAKAKKSFAWRKGIFEKARKLERNVKYRLTLKAPEAKEDCVYEVAGSFSSPLQPLLRGTFKGENSAFSYRDPAELTGFKEEPFKDLCFWIGKEKPFLILPLKFIERMRALILLLVLLLLLLLLGTLFYFTFYRLTPIQREFVRRNRDCLLCHRKMLEKMTMTWVHNPFLKKDCKQCHTDHAERVYKEIVKSYVRIGTRISFYRTCGKMIGLSPNSACGKMFGISLEERIKTTTETIVSKKYRSLMKAGLKKSQKELCTGCHKSLKKDMELSFPHEPFYEGKCTSCHDPHASNYPARTKALENELCLFCHDMSSDFAKATQHPPFKIKSCLSCHNPHASDFQGIVLDTQEILCLSCHPTVAGDISRAVRHKPFDEGVCTDCHFPHSSNVSALLHEQVPYLCYSCHPDIQLDFLKVSRHPVDITWTCLECHAPHASDYSALVNAKDNDLCFGCHSQRITLYSNRSTYNASAHANAVRVGKGLCINCHTPHGSDYPPLEVMPEDDLCHLCHEKFTYDRRDTEKTHPVWEPYLDERIGYKEQVKYGSSGGEVYTYTEIANPNSPKMTLRCSSTCHDPHGTGNYAMLRWVKDALCLTCHQVEEIP